MFIDDVICTFLGNGILSNLFLRIVFDLGRFAQISLLSLVWLIASINTATAQDVALPIRAEIGQAMILDPTDGFVAEDGTALRAEWSWDDRPAVSVAEFSDTTALRPTVTVDVAGGYANTSNRNSPASKN